MKSNNGGKIKKIEDDRTRGRKKRCANVSGGTGRFDDGGRGGGRGSGRGALYGRLRTPNSPCPAILHLRGTFAATLPPEAMHTLPFRSVAPLPPEYNYQLSPWARRG